MPALLAPAIAAALLLALAGAAKVLDPTMTVGALQALHLPSSPTLVRVGSAAEVAIGVAALVVAGPVPFLLAAVSYLAFAAFVAAALRSGTMIGTCGCFGREETPPHALHVVLDLVLAAVALAGAAFGAAPVDLLADDPGVGAVVLGLALLQVALLYAAFVELPRVLVLRATRS